MAKTSLFLHRSAAARRAQDGLDERVRMVPAADGLLAATLALVIGAVAVWAFFGTVRTEVTGTGILLDRGERIVPVHAAGEGFVDGLYVDVGDIVTEGVRLASIAQPLLDAEIAVIERALDDAAGEAPAVAGEFPSPSGPDRWGSAPPTALSLALLHARRDVIGGVDAPVTGMVVEVRTSPGSAISPDDVLLTLAETEGEAARTVLAFLAPELAPRVRVGSPVFVSPVTVPESDYGSMRGTVAFVSASPISTAAVNALLLDPELSRQFTRSAPVHLASIALERDSDTPSGFAWWSGSGPPYPVTHSTLATVRIVIDEVAPVDLVLPRDDL